MTTPLDRLRYLGPNHYVPYLVTNTRNPTPNDVYQDNGAFYVSGDQGLTFWYNQDNETLWFLASFSTSGNTTLANWLTLSASASLNAITKIITESGSIIPNVNGEITLTGVTTTTATGTDKLLTKTPGGGVENTGNIGINPSAAAATSILANAGAASFNNTQFAVDANGFVTLATTTFPQTLTPDVGAAISPVANDIDIKGSPGGNFPTDSILSHNFAAGVMGIENRRWQTAFVVDPSAVVGVRGTYSTIQAAVTAATAGTTIFIRPGTYTENIVMKAGVNLTGFSDGYSATVTIAGTCNFSAAGSVTISGVRLQTNAAPFLTVTGTAASIVYLQNCYLNITNANGIDSTTTSTSSQIWVVNCLGNVANTFHVFDIDHGFIEFLSCTILNTTSTSINTVANDAGAFFKYTYFAGPITTSGTASFTVVNSNMDNATGSTLTVGGTGNNYFHSSALVSGTASTISVGTGATVLIRACEIASAHANPITGLGTVQFSGLSMSQGAINTTTQAPQLFKPGTVSITTPGAYPYTTIPQDYVILVNTTSARTINLNATPATGQTYRIKDNTGTAAANNITITPAAGTIDGAATATINTNFGSVDVTYNGTQWNVFRL